MDIIRINDSFRFIDVIDDLIPIENIKRSEYAYNFNNPTFIPINWSSYKETSQETYSAEFRKKNDIAYKMLLNTTNVVIAGGAAARPLYVVNKNIYTDIDIFIYGIFDEQLFWKKVNEISEIILLTDKDCSITHKIKQGIIIIGITSPHNSFLIEYQIILRMYHTMSSIIHSFDIPSCCVLYDGNIAYTTSLGLYAHLNQVNIVNTMYRSTSFERRLIKYFERGFALELVGYDINKGYDSITKSLKHNYLKFDILQKIGNRITGTISTLIHYKKGIDNEYFNINPKIYTYKEYIVQVQCIENIGIILQCNSFKPINYSKFYNLDVASIIETYPHGINNLIEKQCDQIHRTELRNLKFLKFPKNILQDIFQIMINNIENESYKLINNILMEQIKAHARYVPKWIIIQDPNRQYTASINPIIENPEEWYGSGLYINI